MTFKEFLNERVKQSGTLYIFDIDETLFHTTATIRVVKDGKVLRTLSNKEFNNYDLKDGESFDFSEFRDAEKFNSESKPISNMISILIRVHDKIKLNLTPGSKIIICTARGDFDDEEVVKDTFRQQGIDIDEIPIRKAEKIKKKKSSAEKKSVIIRQYLSRKKYKDAFMYDDSKANLIHFLELENEYPDTNFRAFWVDEDGSLQDFHPEVTAS